MRRLRLPILLALFVLTAAGCSTGQSRVLTYSQQEGGNVAASDSVGSGMSARRANVTTAAVEVPR